jgi:hypothetical protein
MYGRNFKPKIFTDITMPAKQSYGPNIGKLSGIYAFPFIIENHFEKVL